MHVHGEEELEMVRKRSPGFKRYQKDGVQSTPQPSHWNVNWGGASTGGDKILPVRWGVLGVMNPPTSRMGGPWGDESSKFSDAVVRRKRRAWGEAVARIVRKKRKW